MFHKEGSSISSSSGKKFKDVTLRKSERKQLFQSVVHFFRCDEINHSEAAVDGEAFHSVAQEVTISDQSYADNAADTARPKSSMEDVSLLEDIFLRNGEIYERTMTKWTIPSFVSLKETCVANVHQYYRSPTSPPPTTRSSDNTTCDQLTTWPYSLYAQCVWMKIEILGGATPNGTMLYHIPSIALLSVLPPSLYAPFVTYVPSPLSEYICSNGVKHIMRVGLRSLPAYRQHPKTTALSSPSLSFDHMLGITTIVCVQGNPQPMCVGILHPDLIAVTDDPTQNNLNDIPLFGPGCPKGGIGVSVVHAYGDDIWLQQLPTPKEISKIQQQFVQQAQRQEKSSLQVSTYIKSPTGQALFDLGHYGNIGFIDGQCVEPILVEQTQEEYDIEPEHDPNQNAVDNNDISELNTIQLESIQLEDMEDTDDNDDGNCDDTDAHSIQGLDESTVSNEYPNQMLSPDEILHDAVCRALAKIDIKKDLPITMATFYAQFVLPNRKDGTTIQLKQTRYKKFSTYVKEQVDNALLLVGKHVSANNTTDPMGMLIGFDRKHPDLIPYIAFQKEETTALAKAGIVIGVQKRLEIVDLYCVPNHYIALLKLDPNVVKAMNAKTEERRGTGMLTAKEVRSILDDYISEEGLIDANQPDTVILNGPLTDALYKTKKKATVGATDSNIASPAPLSVQRKELVKLWMSRQEAAYALVQVPGNIILNLKRGKPPSITIEVSRRQSKKYLTTVIGLESYGINLLEFAKDVANRFACASTIDTESKSASTDVVVVQGNLSVEIEALLLSDEKLTEHGGVKGSTYFLPKNSIRVVLKKGVPARKKNQLKQ